MHITKKILYDSYDELTQRARIDLDFLLLTVAAAIICVLGFKMNTTSVIVGAMVISPLLYPVICVGAATYQADWRALLEALLTFMTGFIAAIAAAAAVNLVYATTFQSEIIDRLSAAGVDDALVAFFSGLAEPTRSFHQRCMKRLPASRFRSR